MKHAILLVMLAGCVFPQVRREELQSDFDPPKGAVHGFAREGAGAWQKRLMTAVSDDGVHFRKTNAVVTDQGNVPDFILGDDGVLYLYYSAGIAGDRNNVMAVAISFDAGESWVYKYVVIEGTEGMGPPADPDVRRLEEGTFRLFFTSSEPGSRTPGIFYAEGTDGIHFTLQGAAFRVGEELVLDSFTVPIGETWHMYTLDAGGGGLWHGVSMDGKTFTSAGTARFSVEGRPYIPTNEMTLEDGSVRFYAFRPGPGGDIRSFLTRDGFEWEAEEGVRLEVDGNSGLEKDYVKDVAVVKLASGEYLMVYVTVIPE